MRNKPFLIGALIVWCLCSLPPRSAFADCTSPDKPEGTREYFAADDTYKLCDGTNWIDFATDGTLGACSNEAELEYDAGETAYKFCDGTNWQKAVCVAPPPDWSAPTEEKETASDGAAWDGFGISAAIEGDVAVIGAARFAYPINGAAYIFTRSGGVWSQAQKLTASDGASGDTFGASVAVDGDVALIGALGDDSYKGSAYVFTRSGGVWSQTQKLTASDGAGFDMFGFSVAVDGDVAMIGSMYSSGNGATYVFTRSGGVWSQTQKLTASDGAAGDGFGGDVAIIDGDVALVGAYGDDNYEGSAYVFTRSGGVWSQTQKLTASDGVTDDWFGSRVAADGDVAMIGSMNASSAIGAAYVFTNSGGTWSQTQKLTASDGVADDWFGYDVAIDGDTAVISAVEDSDNGSDSGSAYVFTNSGGTWSQTKKLTASDGAVEDWFGESVAISGNVVVVGAMQDDDNGSESGSAYFYTAAAEGASCYDTGAWTSRTSPGDVWRSATYGDGLFVAVGSAPSTNGVMTSPDGINWTARTTPGTAYGWNGVIYGNGLFVAVAQSSTNRVITSPDGINWTARTAAEANAWWSIAYGNSLFVAVAQNGTNRVMTSPNGITWTARAAPEANQWLSVTYGEGLFVAVAQNGTNRVMTSPNGITWTARAAPEANSWKSVTYGEGLFVSVAGSGTNRVMTSPDGITWTPRAAAAANIWDFVTYGNGLFVAVANSGTNRVMTSPDGITWTARAAAAANSWESVTYGDGLFVAVSNDGANQVMTAECSMSEDVCCPDLGTCTSEGTVDYFSTEKALGYCNGANWVSMVSTCP